ncbi:LPD7 domain-containing protein [Oligella urethralis]|uniref:DNA primase TraC n=1 Tax=Oligella urethralis TaxID=90245 RepID=A0A2X1WIP4_9BURK|nr:LPD7 domain-containing protein [Oligella urethralis]SPY08434.1 DNA primase TraC [Oligella urethralis]
MASPYQTPPSISEIETALDYIDNHDRMRWLKIGAALKSELGEDGFSIWDKWSQSAKNYNKGVMNSQWKSLIPGKFNIGTLFYEAMQKGYQPTKEATPLSSQEIAERRAAAIAARQEAEAIRKEEQRVASLEAQKEYEALSPVRSLNHDYLVAKLIDDPKLLNRVRRDGDDLVIPLRKHGEITGLQKINGTGWKSFTKGMELKGSSFVMGPWGNREKGLVLTEGYATAVSIHKATGLTTIVCFAGFNIKSVAESLPKDLDGPIYIAADYDLPSQSGKRAGLEYALAAKAVLGEKATVIEPHFSENDFQMFESLYGTRPSDFNDLHKLHGLEAVNDQFSQKIKEIEVKQSIVSVHLPENEVKTQAEAILEENSISPDRFRIEELREERGDDYVEKSEFTTHTVNEQNIEDDNIKQPTDQAAEQTIKSPSADLEEESGKERIDVEKELRRPVILNHDYDHPPGELKAKFVFTKSGEYIDKDGYYHFADKGDNLKTNKRDLDTVRAMLEVANAKNWEAIQLKGNKEFKRLAYIEASIQGIEARGYTPTERDLAIIKQEREVRGFNTIKEAHTILKSSQETTTRQMPEGATTEREENTSPTPPPQSTDKTSPVKDGATTDEIENEASKRSLAREEAEKDKVANQNRAPDRAVVEDSERVDEKGAEVPMAGIGGNEIRSELRAFMNSFTTKQQGLNADSMAMLRLMKRMVQPMVSNLNKEHRDQAIRNFNEKIDQSITGDRLNIDFPGDRSRPTAEHETPRENSFRDYQPVERTR